MTEEDLKRTPLEANHEALGARMVPFGGWYMPVQYTSILNEHAAVREKAGIFDISHMGQFIVSGPGASGWLQSMLTNNIDALAIGQGQYTLMLNTHGGVIDDLIAYRTGENEYFLVVNASMIEEDYEWFIKNQPDNAAIRNESGFWAGLAVQGPLAVEIYAKVLPGKSLPARNGIHKTAANQIICRTGYTGEDGFEFFCPAAEAGGWWDKFLAAGATACGLGARDTLRLEMGYPLNGNDLSPSRTPIEAGLGFFVDLSTNFTGRDALATQKEFGPSHKLAAIRYLGKGAPPRAHYPVTTPDGTVIGELASGALSPSLMTGIGMAYLPVEFTKPGTLLNIDIRGKLTPAEVVKKPFYKPAKSSS